MSLEFYVEKFQSLRTDSQQGRNRPHKVCLLLAVMDLIEAGHIHENKIYFNQHLKKRFTEIFEPLQGGNDKNTPENPFFHLKSEGFWHLVPNEGCHVEDLKGYSNKGVSHVYLDAELYDFLKSPIVRGDLKAALTQNLTNLPELYVKWAIGLGKSEKTVKNYLSALRGSISNWMMEAHFIEQPLTDIRSFHEYKIRTSKVDTIQEFKDHNKRGKGMYSAAIKSYGTFLADVGQVDIRADVQTILDDRKLTSTEKSIMVNTRMGQGRFRKDLVKQWGGCALTGYQQPQMLVASHIKPWRESNNTERLDSYNGLLLLANIDKAFDLGFISFKNDGKILISQALESPEVLGIHEEMSFNIHQKHTPYLDFHRSVLFAGV